MDGRRSGLGITRRTAKPDQALANSAYGGVYRLAHRITAGARTPYDAVSAIETYLSTHYRYSEFAPIRHLALRTFLLGAHRGYCQHFSGAMALMLRMVGIPARVAAGFSPGKPNSDGNYVVTDFDAHAWVETYFPGIGWVTFDPTPAGAPAQSRVSGLGSSIASSADPNKSSGSSSSDSKLHKGSVDVPNAGSPGSGSGQTLPLIPIVASLGLLALVAIAMGGVQPLASPSAPIRGPRGSPTAGGRLGARARAVMEDPRSHTARARAPAGRGGGTGGSGLRRADPRGAVRAGGQPAPECRCGACSAASSGRAAASAGDCAAWWRFLRAAPCVPAAERSLRRM